MKAITLTQPWATFVAHGLKLTETRSWSTNHRGWLAIHAAKGFPVAAKELCMQDPFEHWLKVLGYTISSLPRGAVIAKVHMIDCVRFDESYKPGAEAPFGDFTPGRYGWIFASVVKFENPIPAKGALSVWEWSEGLCTCGMGDGSLPALHSRSCAVRDGCVCPSDGHSELCPIHRRNSSPR